MSDEGHERLRAIFDRVIELPIEERENALADACGGDDELVRRVRAMIAGSEEATFLGAATRRDETSVAGAPAGDVGSADSERRAGEPGPAATPARESRGDLIGRYKLLQRIGEGGFGTVWMADQLEPVRRRVALKIIKLGMDTEQVIARFEAERQALALMDHPNIAKVFDAGATDLGRPYFVMEYIRGVPIVDFCDGERLDTAGRLGLFEQVCRAIQHAHQKGVIHRDIKPTNVLITMHDGVPVPKVIDFGIAKATNQELTSRTLFTEHRQIIGTPAYMSPEQAEMSGLDIDTRSDVYSLGVLLYELLTGTTPFATRSLLEAGFGEMVRIIREEEPHKPSTRLSSLGASGTQVADRRRTDPRRLGGTLRGDLDWIVMKCLEKDRTRRYDTATGIATDVRRYLDDEPVEASPPGALYRFRKFTRRHRGMVAATIALALLLVAGIVGTSWGLKRAVDANARVVAQTNRASDALRAIASRYGEIDGVPTIGRSGAGNDIARSDEVDALALAAAELVRSLDESREQARRELGRTNEVKSFLTEMLETVDPAEARGRDTVLLREMFDGAAARIESDAIDDPLIEAELCGVVGVALRNLGEYERAEPFLRRALEIRGRELGEDDRSTLESTSDLGILLRWMGRVPEAEALYRTALDGSRRVLGDDDPETLFSISDLGILLRTEGRLDEAEPLLRAALDGRRATLGDDHPDTLTSISNYGLLLRSQGELDEAEVFAREAFDGRRSVLGTDHPATLNAAANLGVLLDALDRHDEAEPLVREALAGRRRVLGNEHPDTLRSINAMAVHLAARDRLDEAEPFYREGYAGTVRALGPDHPDALVALNNLGFVLRRQGRLDEAEPLLREAVERRRRTSGDESAGTLFAVINHGAVLTSLDRSDEAAALFIQFEPNARRAWTGGNARWLGVYLHREGDARARTGDVVGAEAALREALGLLTEGFGVDHERTLACAATLDALDPD